MVAETVSSALPAVMSPQPDPGTDKDLNRMPVDLRTSPRWTAEDLGLPMPDSPHAVSACLPLWQHNVQYEEGDPAVVSKLQAAYPRFCLHPLFENSVADIWTRQRRPDFRKSRGCRTSPRLPRTIRHQRRKNGHVGESASYRSCR